MRIRGGKGGDEWRRRERAREKRGVTAYHILPQIPLRQHRPRPRRLNLKIRNNRNGLNFRRPPKPHTMSNPSRRLRRSPSRIHPRPGPRPPLLHPQNLTNRNLHPRHRRRVHVPQIRTDEPAVQCRSDVIRVALDHEAVVEETGFGEVELGDGVGEEDAGDDGGAGGAEAAV